MVDGRRAVSVALAAMAVLAVFAPILATSAVASPPTESVCPVCGENFEMAVEAAGVDAEATASTATMDVREDGSARFSARVTLTESTATRLTANDSAVDAIVDAAFDESRYVVGLDRASDVTADVTGDTLVVSWTVPDAARESHGGTLLVTLFGEDRNYLFLYADRLVVTGPDGAHVVNAPRSGSVTDGDGGDAVVWKGDADSDDATYLRSGTYVAFGESDGLAARANAELAVASAVGPRMIADAFFAGTPSALLLAGGLAACLFVLSPSPRPGRAARWLAITGGTIAVLGLLYGVTRGQGPLSERNLELIALPAGIAAFGALTARAPAVANLREAALRVVGTVGVGGAIASLVSTPLLSFLVVTFTVTVCGFYLVGVYDQRVGWPVAAVTAIVVVAPILGLLPATPINGFGVEFAAIVLLPITVLEVLVGIATYRIGAGKRVTGDHVVEQRTTA